MFKKVIRFILSVLIAVLSTSLVSTQIILSEVMSLGIPVPFIDRITSTLTDFVGLGITLVALIAPSFLIGFIIAKYAHQLIGGNRKLWYMAAGFCSFPVTLFIMQYFMGLTALASARTPMGMFAVAICCMIGGWFFANLSATSNLKESLK